MKTRILSSLVSLPILLLLVVLGGIYLRVGLLLAALIGMHEFFQAFSPNNKKVHKIGYFFAVVYMVMIQEIMYSPNAFHIFVSLFLLLILIYSVIFHKETNVLEGMTAYFSYFYVCFLLSHVFLVREFAYGGVFVWLIFLSAFGCDTGAYFTGLAIGKHKLIPDLSPKKTVEGAIGGVVVATLLCICYGFVIGRYFDLSEVNEMLLCGLTGFFGSMLSQIGDLAASAMKRYTGIKDFGKLIPGHGGILDRFDSVLLTAPAVYYIMVFLISA